MICVDACLAAKWILEEEFSDQAQALLVSAIREGSRVVAPPLLPIEVTNILRQRMRRDRPPLALADATELLERFLDLPVDIVAPDGLYESALALADAYQLPAAYDAHYVVLAQMLGCSLWTADQRLINALGARLPSVKSIRDYAPGLPL
ncbi:MAG: hypothetical protein HW416_2197 [Chloroflexi bacterium]|nr:hypothetical protein [Chloroflexota bacterium]